MTELGNVSSLLGFGLDRKVLVCEVKVGCLVAFTNICVKFNPRLFYVEVEWSVGFGFCQTPV